ncbi:unnamed protein product, partial [Iphiclides podalirius]
MLRWCAVAESVPLASRNLPASFFNAAACGAGGGGAGGGAGGGGCGLELYEYDPWHHQPYGYARDYGGHVGYGGLLLGRGGLHAQYKPVEWGAQHAHHTHLDPAACAPYSYPAVPGQYHATTTAATRTNKHTRTHTSQRPIHQRPSLLGGLPLHLAIHNNQPRWFPMVFCANLGPGQPLGRRASKRPSRDLALFPRARFLPDLRRNSPPPPPLLSPSTSHRPVLSSFLNYSVHMVHCGKRSIVNLDYRPPVRLPSAGERPKPSEGRAQRHAPRTRNESTCAPSKGIRARRGCFNSDDFAAAVPFVPPRTHDPPPPPSARSEIKCISRERRFITSPVQVIRRSNHFMRVE